MSDNRTWTVEENADFISFLVRKTKNAKSPLNLDQLCNEFKKSSGSSKTIEYLITRIDDICSKIKFADIDTKVKMMFALSAPINPFLMNELRQEAYLELDDKNRIIEYEKRGGGLQLSGFHVSDVSQCHSRKSTRIAMLKFLAEKSQSATLPIKRARFVYEFKKFANHFWDEYCLGRQYDLVKSEIHISTEYDDAIKIKMLFVSETRLHENFLKKLREDAVVETDNFNRITKYKANDGSLELNRNHFHETRTQTERKLSFLVYLSTEEENKKLINFVAEKSKQTNSPLFIDQLSGEFISKNNSSRSVSAVYGLISYFRTKILKLEGFDMTTKVKMAFSLSAPIDQDDLIELREHATVEVDEIQRITKYEAKDGSLNLKGTHWSSAVRRKVVPEIESAKIYKVSKSKFSEDVIYDGPGEPIPAELSVKRERNVYDELFWQEKEHQENQHEFLRKPIPNQLLRRQHPIEYQKQIFQEEEYKPDPDQLVVKLESMEHQEQDSNRQEEEFKPDRLELFNMKQNSFLNSIDNVKFEDTQLLENDAWDHSVGKTKDRSLKLKENHRSCKSDELKRKFSEDLIYDGPGKPIPADLPVKQEPNSYHKLFWQDKVNKEYERGQLGSTREPVPNQFPIEQGTVEYQDQNWQAEEYKPAKIESLEEPIIYSSEVKLESMDYQEQAANWQEEEYKPDPLDIMIENGPWTVKEDEDFIHFLVEKADNVISPLDSAQLCDEFKQRSGSTRTVESLVKRIDVICWEPHFTYFRKLMDFDAYKKLKTMFTSSAPISLFLLIERKIEDDLGKDNPNQRRVQFSQVPLNLSVSEINEKLTQFLTGISQNPNSLTNSVVFVKQFDAEATFRQQYYVHKKQIYVKTVKKLFVSQVRIDNSVLKELRKDAVVEVDEKNRMIEYISHDGRLILKQKDDVVKRNKENEQLMKFIAEKCKETEAPLSIKQLSREFIEQIGLSVKESRIENRIRSLLPKIPKLEDFDTETKVRMLFSLNASIDQDYLNELQKNAIVEVDEKRRIIKYATNDGVLNLQERHWSSALKRKYRLEIQMTTQKHSSTEKCKVSKSNFSEDVIYDGPKEPIPAELSVKRETNVYDELFWQEQEYNESHHQLLERQIPNQLPSGQEPIEYQEQIWQEDEYKQDRIMLLEELTQGQPEVKLEPMEYQEQNTNWQKEEYKPDPLELFDMEQYPNGHSIDKMKFGDSQILEYNELDYIVKN